MGLSLLSAHISYADTPAAPRELTLEDYKYFRALSIDLQGRVPTRTELQAFEQPGFDVDQWIDAHLSGDEYVDRMTRIYSDLLRPQISNYRLASFARAGLSSVTYRGPDGKLTRLYFRPSQVRARVLAMKTTLNADTNYKACVAIKSPATDPQYVTLNCVQYEKAGARAGGPRAGGSAGAAGRAADRFRARRLASSPNSKMEPAGRRAHP